MGILKISLLSQTGGEESPFHNTPPEEQQRISDWGKRYERED
jgi:hypothetical protein